MKIIYGSTYPSIDNISGSNYNSGNTISKLSDKSVSYLFIVMHETAIVCHQNTKDSFAPDVGTICIAALLQLHCTCDKRKTTTMTSSTRRLP
jgi:hypothetical protein